MKDVVIEINKALGVRERARQIEHIWKRKVGDGDMATMFAARDLATKEKWARAIFYGSCVTLVPALLAFDIDLRLGLVMLGATMASGLISWNRAREVNVSVEQEKLARTSFKETNQDNLEAFCGEMDV